MATPWPAWRDLVQAQLDPAVILSLAVYHFLQTLLETLLTSPLSLLPLRPTRDRAFGRFWAAFSPPRPADPAALKGSAALEPALLRDAAGVVLELGPGNGTQAGYYDGARITAMYGAEPTAQLHEELRRRVGVAGLGAKYTVVACGAEVDSLIPGLAGAGVLGDVGTGAAGEGVFDTIVACRVLCSVGRQAGTVRGLYGLLKPGGRLIVLEHVVNPWRADGWAVARAMQALYMCLGWSFFLGDCCMDRDTEGVLRRAADVDGGWEEVRLRSHFAWQPLCYISGWLRKKENV